MIRLAITSHPALLEMKIHGAFFMGQAGID